MREDYVPFDNAEEVWSWFCSSLSARSDGIRSKSDYWGVSRICELADIHNIIKIMKKNHHISNRHLRVMIKWGSEQNSQFYRIKRSEIRLWEEGIRNFEVYLKHKKIL